MPGLTSQRPDKTVLVVEDDPDVRDAVAEGLERAGYHVATAPDGAAALAWLERQAETPAAILLDWMMPVLDGMGFLSRQSAEPRLAAIPVAVVSAVGATAPIPRPWVAEVMVKPVRLRALIDVVDRLCGGPPREGGGQMQWEHSVGVPRPDGSDDPSQDARGVA